jgi:hypothetical protein
VESVTPVTHGSNALISLGVLVRTPESYPRMCRKTPFADARCGCQIATNEHKLGALFLHVHPPPIAHTHCVRGPSICANHTATAVKSAITISLQVATGCAGVMSVCANQSSLSRHNFGGCLAKTANKGGISSSRYTRFERTYLIGCHSSNAGVVSPNVP